MGTDFDVHSIIVCLALLGVWEGRLPHAFLSLEIGTHWDGDFAFSDGAWGRVFGFFWGGLTGKQNTEPDPFYIIDIPPMDGNWTPRPGSTA